LRKTRRPTSEKVEKRTTSTPPIASKIGKAFTYTTGITKSENANLLAFQAPEEFVHNRKAEAAEVAEVEEAEEVAPRGGASGQSSRGASNKKLRVNEEEFPAL